MQHSSLAVNASPQLNGDEAPWKLRFGEDSPGQLIPFAAKILFWNNPNRAGNTSGKMSPTANDGTFLGYHIQPGFAWKGEYLVAKLEALDYHAENGSITVQRARRIELVPGGFTFPLRAMQEAKEPKPDRLEDNVIADPRPIPFQSELPSGADVQPKQETADESTEAVLDALAQPDKSPDDEIFPKKLFRSVFIGMAHVKSYKGSQHTSHQISGECSAQRKGKACH